MKFEIEVESMPDGFRPVAYRPVEKGERFLGRDGEVIEAALGHFAPWLILEPIEAEPAEQAATKFLNGLGDEIKALSERVAALEGGAKEPNLEPQKYGLYGRPDGPEGICDYFQWHEESPFDSAGQAVAYADSHFMEDWRNRWRVYPYPEDGGKPVELREEKWGPWWDKDGRWVIYNGDIYKAKSKEKAEDLKRAFCNPDGITAYPYPADGGMPVELRETPVTVSPGGTNYVYDQPKLPTLWGVWLEQDNRWAGSNMGEGCIAFFRSKVASEKYAFACGGEARPLPIEELIKDA